MPRTEVSLRSGEREEQSERDCGGPSMSRPLYDLSSLPSTLSMMSPAGRRRKEADSIALLQNENIQDCLKVDVSGDPAEDLDGKLNKCDKIDESPTEKNVSTIKNDSTKDRNFFRRIARVSEEVCYVSFYWCILLRRKRISFAIF